MQTKKISRKLYVPLSREKAFDAFVNKLNTWWPKQYTWSQELVAEIRIEPQQDGMCIEIGPYGFRCDWGRVYEFELNSKLAFKWQVSPNRVPEPNPEKASDVAICFKAVSEQETILEFEHYNFENHGEGARAYQEAMDAEQGWTYILDSYVTFCKQ